MSGIREGKVTAEVKHIWVEKSIYFVVVDLASSYSSCPHSRGQAHLG